jgi:hypothetical protein
MKLLFTFVCFFTVTREVSVSAVGKGNGRRFPHRTSVQRPACAPVGLSESPVVVAPWRLYRYTGWFNQWTTTDWVFYNHAHPLIVRIGFTGFFLNVKNGDGIQQIILHPPLCTHPLNPIPFSSDAHISPAMVRVWFPWQYREMATDWWCGSGDRAAQWAFRENCRDRKIWWRNEAIVLDLKRWGEC